MRRSSSRYPFPVCAGSAGGGGSGCAAGSCTRGARPRERAEQALDLAAGDLQAVPAGDEPAAQVEHRDPRRLVAVGPRQLLHARRRVRVERHVVHRHRQRRVARLDPLDERRRRRATRAAGADEHLDGQEALDLPAGRRRVLEPDDDLAHRHERRDRERDAGAARQVAEAVERGAVGGDVVHRHAEPRPPALKFGQVRQGRRALLRPGPGVHLDPRAARPRCTLGPGPAGRHHGRESDQHQGDRLRGGHGSLPAWRRNIRDDQPPEPCHSGRYGALITTRSAAAS